MKIYLLLNVALCMYTNYACADLNTRANPVCCLEPSATYPLPDPYMALLSVAFSPDGKLLATSHSDGTFVGTPLSYVTVFHVDDAGVLSAPASHALPDGSINRQPVNFSPDGSLLATFQSYAGSGTNGVIIFKVNNSTLEEMTLYSMPITSIPVALAFSPDSSYLATANTVSKDISVFPIINNTLGNSTSYALPAGSDTPMSVAFSPDGKLFAVGVCDTNDVVLFNVVNGTLSGDTSYPLPSGFSCPSSTTFSPDGTLLATASVASN